MARFKVSLSTIASFEATVEAKSAESAEEEAFQLAHEWANQYHHTGSDTYVTVNDEWQYQDPETTEVSS